MVSSNMLLGIDRLNLKGFQRILALPNTYFFSCYGPDMRILTGTVPCGYDFCAKVGD